MSEDTPARKETAAEILAREDREDAAARARAEEAGRLEAELEGSGRKTRPAASHSTTPPEAPTMTEAESPGPSPAPSTDAESLARAAAAAAEKTAADVEALEDRVDDIEAGRRAASSTSSDSSVEELDDLDVEDDAEASDESDASDSEDRSTPAPGYSSASASGSGSSSSTGAASGSGSGSAGSPPAGTTSGAAPAGGDAWKRKAKLGALVLAGAAILGTAMYKGCSSDSNGNGVAPEHSGIAPLDTATRAQLSATGTAPVPSAAIAAPTSGSVAAAGSATPVAAALVATTAPAASYIAAINSNIGNTQNLQKIMDIANVSSLSLDEKLGVYATGVARIDTTQTGVLYGTVSGATTTAGEFARVDATVVETLNSLIGKTDAEVRQQLSALRSLGYSVRQNGNQAVVELHGATGNAMENLGQLLLSFEQNKLASATVRKDDAFAGAEIALPNMAERGAKVYHNGLPMTSAGGQEVNLNTVMGAYVLNALRNDFGVNASDSRARFFHAQGDAQTVYVQTTDGATIVSLGNRNLFTEAQAEAPYLNARAGNFQLLRTTYDTASDADKARAKTEVLAYLRSDAFKDQRAYIGIRHIREGPQRELGISGPLGRLGRPLGTITPENLATAVEAGHLDMDDMLEALSEQPSNFVRPINLDAIRALPQEQRDAAWRRAETAYAQAIDTNWTDLGPMRLNTDLVPYAQGANGRRVNRFDQLHQELGDEQGGSERGHLRAYLRVGPKQN